MSNVCNNVICECVKLSISLGSILIFFEQLIIKYYTIKPV